MAQVRDGFFRGGMTAEEAGRADAQVADGPLRKPRPFRRRRWLNRVGFQTTAFIYADLSVTQDKWEDDDGNTITKRYVNGDLIISDCTRQITLTVEGDQNTIRKLETLAAALLDARDWLVTANDWMWDGNDQEKVRGHRE